MFRTNHNNEADNSGLESSSQKQQPLILGQDVNLQSVIDNERETILEREEILSMQQKRFKPIDTGMFFIMILATMTPILNIILLLMWSFKKNTNVNRKSFAQATLMWVAIFFVSFIILLLTIILSGQPITPAYWFNEFKVYVNSIEL